MAILKQSKTSLQFCTMFIFRKGDREIINIQNINICTIYLFQYIYNIYILFACTKYSHTLTYIQK